MLSTIGALFFVCLVLLIAFGVVWLAMIVMRWLDDDYTSPPPSFVEIMMKDIAFLKTRRFL